MDMELRTVTPEIATHLLAGQLTNRALKSRKVNEWAHDMTSGRWQPVPQPIMIDPDGHLIDGQHRLTAVVKSGVSVEMWVARDVPRDLRRYIDGGTARTAADVLRMDHGFVNQGQVQSIANSVLRYEIAPGRWRGIESPSWFSPATTYNDHNHNEQRRHHDKPHRSTVARHLSPPRHRGESLACHPCQPGARRRLGGRHDPHMGRVRGASRRHRGQRGRLGVARGADVHRG